MSTILERAIKFDEENPQVYKKLVELAYQMKDRGHKKIGIGMLFEVIRWFSKLQTNTSDFKVNNSYRAYFSRKIMNNEPGLQNIFNIRD